MSINRADIAPPTERELLFSAEQIRTGIGQLAIDIQSPNSDLLPYGTGNNDITVIGVLPEAVPFFAADLTRELGAADIGCQFDWLGLMNHGDGPHSVFKKIQASPDLKVADRQVLLLYGRFQSGGTAHRLEHFLQHGEYGTPRSIAHIALVQQASPTTVHQPDASVFYIPDTHEVVGYGLQAQRTPLASWASRGEIYRYGSRQVIGKVFDQSAG